MFPTEIAERLRGAAGGGTPELLAVLDVAPDAPKAWLAQHFGW